MEPKLEIVVNGGREVKRVLWRSRSEALLVGSLDFEAQGLGVFREVIMECFGIWKHGHMFDSAKFFGFPIASTKFLYIALGEVRAGIDLSEMDISQISKSDSVTMAIPRARILDTKIDIGRSYVYNVRGSIFSSHWE